MYRAGIVTGVDALHNCNPDDNIKRSEVAAIISRMMDEDNRVKFDMPDPDSDKNTEDDNDKETIKKTEENQGKDEDADKDNTKEVWFYDLRTNMPSFGKTNPLKEEHFAEFEAAYTAEDRRAAKDERWSVFTREEIKAKGNSLDLGLIRDDSVLDYNDLPDPIESAEEAVANLEEAVDLLMSVIRELKSLEA
jgi:hypothetical protein